MPSRHVAPAKSLQEGSRGPPGWACQEGVGPPGAEREPTLSRAPVLRALPPAPSGALLPQGGEGSAADRAAQGHGSSWLPASRPQRPLHMVR